MLIAIPEWNGRLSPVFDEARNIRLYQIEGGILSDRRQYELSAGSPEERIALLVQEGIQTLICGAISGYSQRLAEMNGIKVVPFIAGEVEQVLIDWLSGNWQQTDYFMPGCGRGQRNKSRNCRRQGRSDHNRLHKHNRR
jgi:predicted Fe-Mo cluster-binding NifX family protein